MSRTASCVTYSFQCDNIQNLRTRQEIRDHIATQEHTGKVYRVEELAEIFHVTVQTIYNWIDNGWISYYPRRFGWRKVVSDTSLKHFARTSIGKRRYSEIFAEMFPGIYGARKEYGIYRGGHLESIYWTEESAKHSLRVEYGLNSYYKVQKNIYCGKCGSIIKETEYVSLNKPLPYAYPDLYYCDDCYKQLCDDTEYF